MSASAQAARFSRPEELRRVSLKLPGQPAVTETLWLPFASGRHPATDQIEEENLAWLRQHGLLTDANRAVFRRARFHELAGRVYHREDRDALRITADFIAALFVLDDLMDTAGSSLCHDPARARLAMEVVRSAAHSGRAREAQPEGIHRIASALADITRRLAARGAPLHRYLAELDAYLEGVVEETGRRQRRFVDVKDYADLRVSVSAVYACIELGFSLQGRGSALPDALRPLTRAANLSVSWVNDLFSWPKERALEEPSNLIQVLVDHHGISEAEAFRQGCSACDEVVRDYLVTRDGLGGASAATELLERWMQGNYDWHAEGTARYTDHLSVAPDVVREPALRVAA